MALSADDFDALVNSLGVLSDPPLLAAHRDGQAALAAGDYVDAEQLAQLVEEAGRLP